MTAFRVAVIGGGISGLSTAHYLSVLSRRHSFPVEIDLFEASPSFGGSIATEKKDGFLIEKGADSFLSEKTAAVELCKELGIENELTGTQARHRRSLIYKNGNLYPVPDGFYLFTPVSLAKLIQTPAVSFSGKIRMAAELFVPAYNKPDEESVSSFVSRRFGREVLEKIAQPMAGGIYMADPDKLSLDAVFPRFREMERRHGSVMRGMMRRRKEKEGAHLRAASGPRYSLFLTLKDGMGRLIEALNAQLQNTRVHLSSPVKRIQPLPQRKWRVIRADGKVHDVDSVFLTSAARKTSAMIDTFAEKDFCAALESIPYESAVTLNLAFRKTDLERPLEAFGFIVPASENKTIAACTFSSVKWNGRAPEDRVLLRVFMGGAFGRKLISQTDEELEKTVLDELKPILGISGKRVFSILYRLPDSMPQYYVGHLARVAAIEKYTAGYPGLYLTGSAYRGVGIPDCIQDAQKTAAKAAAYFTGRDYL